MRASACCRDAAIHCGVLWCASVGRAAWSQRVAGHSTTAVQWVNAEAAKEQAAAAVAGQDSPAVCPAARQANTAEHLVLYGMAKVADRLSRYCRGVGWEPGWGPAVQFCSGFRCLALCHHLKARYACTQQEVLARNTHPVCPGTGRLARRSRSRWQTWCSYPLSVRRPPGLPLLRRAPAAAWVNRAAARRRQAAAGSERGRGRRRCLSFAGGLRRLGTAHEQGACRAQLQRQLVGLPPGHQAARCLPVAPAQLYEPHQTPTRTRPAGSCTATWRPWWCRCGGRTCRWTARCGRC